MPITHRFGIASGLVRGGCGLLAIVPSAAILAGIVPIPASVRVLADYVTSAVALASLLAVILLGDMIDRLPKAATAVLVVVAALCGTGAAAEYFDFARHHVVAVPNEPELIIPLNPSAELSSLLRPYGADYPEALATSIQRDRIESLMREEDSSAILAIVSLLVLAQALIISALVVGAWKLAHEEAVDGN